MPQGRSAIDEYVLGVGNMSSLHRLLAMVGVFLLGGSLMVGLSWAQDQDPFSKSNEFSSGATTTSKSDQEDPFSKVNALNEDKPSATQPAPTQNSKTSTPAAQPVRENRLTKQLGELISFDVQVQPKEVRPGEVVKVTLTGKIKEGWHTYPINTIALAQTQVSTLKYGGTTDLKPLYPIDESEPVSHLEKDGSTLLELVGKFTWTQKFLVDPKAKPGEKTLQIIPHLIVCNEFTCLPEGDYRPLSVTVRVKEGPAAAVPDNVKAQLQKPAAPTVINTGGGQGGLLGLLFSAFAGAFLMLLTPCVFPMIPITVNFFLKQSEKERHNPLATAVVYSGTIILLLTAVVLIFGNVVIFLANNAWFNLALGAVLIVFALSLFGMYELELPSGLARFTSAREGQGGYLGAIFMALTFTITSFTCTGPFLGALLAPVASLRPPLWQLVLAALVYSTTFAAPFFLLALFPTMLKALPKSGGWLNAIKVTMGFLELAAALKFLANTDMSLSPGDPRIFNFDTVLCAWIALSVACGLYLINAYRLPHDDKVEKIGVVRMLFAALFLGLAIYMTPLLVGVQPAGIIAEAVVAFLPPSYRETPARGNGEAQLAWHLDYDQAWQEAVKGNKLIFIDFTGQNCTNCRANEKNVFSRSDVQAELKKYVRVQLYTDTVPKKGLPSSEAAELASRNMGWQEATINDVTLPSYVILQPDPRSAVKDGKLQGKIVGVTGGLIQNVSDFIVFLKRPLESQVAAQKNDSDGRREATQGGNGSRQQLISTTFAPKLKPRQ
jgi:thiol:disulfide interchange protein DsbD